jgi:hypothetical protein
MLKFCHNIDPTRQNTCSAFIPAFIPGYLGRQNWPDADSTCYARVGVGLSCRLTALMCQSGSRPSSKTRGMHWQRKATTGEAPALAVFIILLPSCSPAPSQEARCSDAPSKEGLHWQRKATTGELINQSIHTCLCLALPFKESSSHM